MENSDKTFEINTLYMTNPNEYIPVLILNAENEKVHGNLHIQFINAKIGKHEIEVLVESNKNKNLISNNEPINVNLENNHKNIIENKSNHTLIGELALDFWADLPKGESDFIKINITIDKTEKRSIQIFVRSIS